MVTNDILKEALIKVKELFYPMVERYDKNKEWIKWANNHLSDCKDEQDLLFQEEPFRTIGNMRDLVDPNNIPDKEVFWDCNRLHSIVGAINTFEERGKENPQNDYPDWFIENLIQSSITQLFDGAEELS